MENGVFRSAIGGFNREDVLKFIENQKQTEAELRASIAAFEKKISEMSAELDRAVADKNAAVEKLAFNPDAREAQSALAIKDAEYRALEKKYSELSETAAAAEKKSAELSNETELLKAHIADIEKQPRDSGLISSLREENNRLKSQLAEEKKKADEASAKSLEEQVGTAFVDARRFADQIVSEAKNNADEINAKTAAAISSASRRTSALSSEISLCAERCEGLFADMMTDLENIKQELDDCLQKMKPTE